jgi:ribokinase
MKNVIVAGSINMDVVAAAVRYPAIGETVPGTEVFFFPGGKGANQAVASAKLGAPTMLIGRIGADAFGRELRSFLLDQNVDLSSVTESADTHSGTAIITVVDSDNAIVVVPGANALVDEAAVDAATINAGDVLLSQFEIPIATISAFFRRGQSVGATTILNPAPAIEFDRDLLSLTDVLILNETELAFLTSQPIAPDEPLANIIRAAQGIRYSHEQVVCVTLGARGAVAVLGSKVVSVAGRQVAAVDTTGAGDCFVGAVAAHLAGGGAIADALGVANAAASICVQRMGAGPSMPTAAEVKSVMSGATHVGVEITNLSS